MRSILAKAAMFCPKMTPVQRKYRSILVMKLGSVSILIILSVQLKALAQNVRDISEYPKPDKVQVSKVAVEISRVNHSLLRADYSFMKSWSNEKIETWLSENLNLIATSQALQSEANTHIEHQPYDFPKKTNPTLTAPFVSGVFRPEGYGRALIIEVYDPLSMQNFYFDGKGLGAVKPKPLPHQTGLASFGEANREITMSTLIDRVLKNEGAKIAAVQSYFQFQYQFDMREKISDFEVAVSRAGSVFRQTNLRPIKKVAGKKDYLGGADPKTSLEVESILRRYGITSAGANFDDAAEISNFMDVTNVQITRDGKKIYDFGGYLVDREFKLPMIEWDTLVDYLKKYPATPNNLRVRLQNRDKKLMKLILSMPGNKNFIQPSETKKVLFDFFGYGNTNVRSVRYDGPWVYAHDMDREARKQELKFIPRSWIESHGTDVLNNLVFLKSKEKTCESLF